MSMIPKKASGFVYFIQDENGLVKIGISINAYDRLKQLQTGSSQKLKLLGSIETEEYKYLEKNLHAQYKESRVKGEWFDITVSEVWKIIETHKKPELVKIEEIPNSPVTVLDLHAVQYKGTFKVPDSRFDIIAVVTYCEYEETNLYVSEMTIGKGSLYHQQYQISEIPEEWTLLGESEWSLL